MQNAAEREEVNLRKTDELQLSGQGGLKNRLVGDELVRVHAIQY